MCPYRFRRSESVGSLAGKGRPRSGTKNPGRRRVGQAGSPRGVRGHVHGEGFNVRGGAAGLVRAILPAKNPPKRSCARILLRKGDRGRREATRGSVWRVLDHLAASGSAPMAGFPGIAGAAAPPTLAFGKPVSSSSISWPRACRVAVSGSQAVRCRTPVPSAGSPTCPPLRAGTRPLPRPSRPPRS